MRMKPTAAFLAIVALTCHPASAFEAPPATIPELPASGGAAADFAPPGWIVEAEAKGDLDGDGTPDVAFVLRGTDPALKIKGDGLGPETLDTNPRIVGVAVAREGGYRLVARNATLIPRNDVPSREDTFEKDGLSIARGALKIELTHFMTAGGWGAANASFLFRLREGRLEAVGYDRFTVQRNTGETETLSVNYLTRRMSRATGTIETDPDTDKKAWTRLRTQRPPTIDEIGDGLDFDPKK